MTQYKLGVRQNTFANAASPWYGVWTLRPVNEAAHQYLLEPTLYTGPALSQPASQRRVSASPVTLGDFCNPASAAQVFRIAGTP